VYWFKVLVLVTVFSLYPIVPLSAQNEEVVILPFVMPSTRFTALGGNHAAMADDFYAIFLNPAAFVDIEREFSAAEFTFSFYGPMPNIIEGILINWITETRYDVSDVVGPVGFGAGMELGMPLSLGWINRGLALGLFSKVYNTSEVIRTRWHPSFFGELFFTAGYSYRIINNRSHKFDVGLLGKGFARAGLHLQAPLRDAALILVNIETRPADLNLGGTFDFGIRYNAWENLTFAIVCYDVFSRAISVSHRTLDNFLAAPTDFTEAVPAIIARSLDVSTKIRISSRVIDRYVSHISLMGSYRNILDMLANNDNEAEDRRDTMLNFGVGFEVVLHKVFTLRAGFTEMLPAFGIGMDFSFATIDFAYFTKELGMKPGDQPVKGLSFGITFRY